MTATFMIGPMIDQHVGMSCDEKGNQEYYKSV